MKRRNLILSLICSIILTVSLVSYTVFGLVAPKKNGGNNNNESGNIEIEVPEIPENQDGTVENPYYIVNAKDFSEMLKQHGTENANFAINNDIDFAGVDFAPLFVDGQAFNGTINGNGHVIKNITINVNKANFNNVIYKNSDVNGRYTANVGIFGRLENAKVLDVNFEEVKINIAEEVYDYIRTGAFAVDHEGIALNEITVGTVAGVAVNSEIQANVKSTINADAYAIYLDNKVRGFNAIGGVVGYSNNSNIHDAVVDVNYSETNFKDDLMNTGKPNMQGKRFYVAGVAGYAYNNSVIANADVNLKATYRYDKVLFVGGVVGVAKTLTINNANVALNVKDSDLNNRKDVNNIVIDSNANMAYSTIGGIANQIIANNVEEKSNIDNISVNADVDIDAIYAGVVVYVTSEFDKGLEDEIDILNLEISQFNEMARNNVSATRLDLQRKRISNRIFDINELINSKDYADVDLQNLRAQLDALKETLANKDERIEKITFEKIFVTISNVSVASKVNVLKAYGIAKYIKCTSISMKNVEGEYNLVLEGQVRLNMAASNESIAAIANPNKSFAGVKASVSEDIYQYVPRFEKFAYKTANIIK